MSVEFVDQSQQLPIAYRNTISNMMAEAEAQNGILAPDEVTHAWFRTKDMEQLPYPALRPGARAHYEIDETIDLSEVVQGYPAQHSRSLAMRSPLDLLQSKMRER